MSELEQEEAATHCAVIGDRPRARCPVGDELGVLGKKWSLHILRNIAELKADRFNDMLRALPGLTPRVLAIRLRELERCQLIRAVEVRPKYVRWALTEKGRDTMPIYEGYRSFASKWRPGAAPTALS